MQMIDLKVDDQEKFAKNIAKTIREKIRNPKRSIRKLAKEQQMRTLYAKNNQG